MSMTDVKSSFLGTAFALHGEVVMVHMTAPDTPAFVVHMPPEVAEKIAAGIRTAADLARQQRGIPPASITGEGIMPGVPALNPPKRRKRIKVKP